VNGGSDLGKLLKEARRRSVFNQALEHLSLGVAASAVGAIVLLLAGTQLLEWYWLAALFAAAAGGSAWRSWGRFPSLYKVSQRIDRSLSLDDTLSTAFFFAHPGKSRRVSEPLKRMQQAEAERLSATVPAAAAVPLRFPRRSYAAFGLLMLAGGVFLLRYAVRGSLDLRPPLVEAVVDFFWPTEVATRNKPPILPGEPPLGITLDGSEDRKGELDPGAESALDVVDTPDVNNSSSTSEKRGQFQTKGERQPNENSGDESESSESGRSDASPAQPDSSQRGNQQDGDPAQAPQGGDNASLLNKLRDAMANLMAKLKTPPGAGQQSASRKSQSGSQDQRQQASQKGQQGAGRPDQQGRAGEDSDNGEQGEGGEQAQAGQGKSSDRNADPSGLNDAKSGAGQQDGDKQARDAAMQEAMGQLSEIFGRRAANIAGEVMVEVTSGKQQALKTPYSRRSATHRDMGGEISRDEIPLALQQYVKQYFEEVRKAPPAVRHR